MNFLGIPRGRVRSTLVIIAVCYAPTTLIGAGGARSLADKLRQGPGVSNHPVHVRPSAGFDIPEGWPLDIDGSITCLTCHTELPSLLGDGPTFLRNFDAAAEAATDFCLKCHSSEQGQASEATHWRAVGVAHIKGGRDRYALASGGLDTESARCVSCHDGVSAKEARFGTAASRSVGFAGDPRRDHPVGIAYGGRGKSDARLQSASLLPSEVRLPGGKVSCVSCHNLYSSEPNHLVVPIDGSKLCLTCHRM